MLLETVKKVCVLLHVVKNTKKYSGSKSINAPMPPNVKEFEYVPVNNDVDQDLEERVGGEANKIHT